MDDVDIKLILEFKQSFENTIQSFQKVFFGHIIHIYPQTF